MVTLARFGQEQFFLLLRLETQTGLRRTDARLGLAFPFFLADAQIRGPLILQFGFPGVGLQGQFLFALLELCLESQFFLLQFLLQSRVGLTRFGFELAFPFQLPATRLLLSLRLHFAETNLRLRLQLLLPLFEPDLGTFVSLLHLLFPARVQLKGTGLELTLKLRLAAAGFLLQPGLFLHQAGVKSEGQFLLTLFQSVFKVLFALAQRLSKLQLLSLRTVLLLTGSLLHLAGGVLFGLRQLEGK